MGQSDEEKTRQQLQQLRQTIKQITREISQEKAQKETLQTQLRTTEKKLGGLQHAISENKKELTSAKAQLKELQGEQEFLNSAKEKQKNSISEELKSAYQMGRQGNIKVLLNQEKPDTVARMMAYHQYFLAARNERVEKYRQTLDRLDSLESKISTLNLQLEETGKELALQHNELNSAQKERKHTVAKLDASIVSKGGKLKQLEADRRELERLLEAIEIAVVNLQLPDNFKAFASAKGKMPWPVAGVKPKNRYGRYRNEGKMLWQGVSIPAPAGTPVTAIHHGRVVYADWLRGSGLLLIIDHGEGYMSLYAHNQSLLTEVGEWVTAGTPVSTVGSSGGQNSAAVYFEIRQNGKPTNPGKWCKG